MAGQGDVREENPKSKKYIAEMVLAHPDLLKIYKELAKSSSALSNFNDDEPTVATVCGRLVNVFSEVPKGAKHADQYHQLVLGALTALFYPSLTSPHKEWDIHDGRKRIDIVFTNSGDTGFFAQRRDDQNTGANVVVVECKNYSDDINNPELDQLLGRFDRNRGKLGILTCRTVDKPALLKKKLKDASSRQQGYIILLTDEDIIKMLSAKARLEDEYVDSLLHQKYRELLA